MEIFQAFKILYFRDFLKYFDAPVRWRRKKRCIVAKASFQAWRPLYGVVFSEESDFEVKNVPKPFKTYFFEIVKNLKSVDEVFLSIDSDKTVCKSLEKLKPSIFANGGDRKNYEIPESKVCVA